MLFLFFISIFCDICIKYFELDEKKEFHNCKIDSSSCYYNNLLPNRIENWKLIHLESSEAYENTEKNIKELNDYKKNLFEAFDTYIFHKFYKINENLRSDFLGFFFSRKEYDKNSFPSEIKLFEYIKILVLECSKNVKIYLRYFESDIKISLVDNKMNIDGLKNRFRENLENFDSLKFDTENTSKILLENKIKKYMEYKHIFENRCDQKDKTFINIKKLKESLMHTIVENFSFNIENSVYEINRDISETKNEKKFRFDIKNPLKKLKNNTKNKKITDLYTISKEYSILLEDEILKQIYVQNCNDIRDKLMKEPIMYKKLNENDEIQNEQNFEDTAIKKILKINELFEIFYINFTKIDYEDKLKRAFINDYIENKLYQLNKLVT